MSRYKLITKQLPDIIEEARQKEEDDYGLDIGIIKKAIGITSDFIKRKELKMYGGIAINELIKRKDIKKAIYDEYDNNIPDLDVYSPDPIFHVMELCNILYNEGIEDIMGEEKMHDMSYGIKIDKIQIFDCTYVPKNAYYNIPVIKINGYNYTLPRYLMIDLYKQYIDIYEYSWRLDKAFIRATLLEQLYPFPKPKEMSIKNKRTNEKKDIIAFVYENVIQNNNKIILMGDYAYNFFIKNSKLNIADKMRYPINYFTAVSTDYKATIKEIYGILIDEYGDALKVNEYRKYVSFAGRSIEFLHNDETILFVYDNIGLCIPNKKVHDETVNIGSFHYVLRMLYILLSKAEIKKNNQDILKYRWQIYNMMISRNNFLKVKNLNGLENSIFQEFQLNCIGKKILTSEYYKLRIAKRKKEKMKLVWRYTPADKVRDPKNERITYDNVSGNLVINEKDKIIKEGMS